MQLNLLKTAILDYEKALVAGLAPTAEFFYEICENWKDNWAIDAPDFIGMFDKSLESKLSRKLWKDERGDAKTMLMNLMRLDPEFGRRLFRGLLDSEKPLSNRISHFQFGCDVLMEEYKVQNKSSNLTDHLHGGPYYPMLYLFFSQPDHYAAYFHGDFKHFMLQVKAHPPYDAADVERFLKVNRTVYHYLSTNESIQACYERSTPKQYAGGEYQGFQLLGFYAWYGSNR